MIRVPSIGPVPAKIMIVGEAPGSHEEQQGRPFVGASGHELSKMLNEAMIARADCFITNVCKYRPPGNDIAAFFLDKKCTVPGKEIEAGIKELAAEIDSVRPNVIIALGGTALWATTGKLGIKNWRGSVMELSLPNCSHKCKVIPTWHPAAILRQWELRPQSVIDLRRAYLESSSPVIQKPAWNFRVRPSFEAVMGYLNWLHAKASSEPTKIALDIETRYKEVACIGIAWSELDAICIPLMCIEKADGYWTEEQETTIISTLATLLRAPNLTIIGQNYSYDNFYLASLYGIRSPRVEDTMVMQHVCFAGTPKSLAYLSSIYCKYHRYWKDDGRYWDPRKMTEEALWTYNCEDCVRTFEIHSVLSSTIDHLNLRTVYEFQMFDLWIVVQEMMLRGVKVDRGRRGALTIEVQNAVAARESWINTVLGRPLNVRSPKQMTETLYGDLQCKPVKSRQTGKVTTNDEALETIARREPELLPFIRTVQEIRSLSVYLGTFITAEIDNDARIRCSYNVAGPETYRLSSSENPFGGGTNLQNIPRSGTSVGHLTMPDIRSLFIPDQGYTIADCDLDRADLQVVVWESNDDDLKHLLRMGVDLHLKNGADLEGIDIPVDELVESHPNYLEHKKRYAAQRQFAKSWIHGTNYGGSARTMAIAAACTVHQSELMQRRWFSLHPGIKDWHNRIGAQLHAHRYVENAFGYRRFYFDRVDGLLPEALAWIPQSTVAIITYRGMVQIRKTLPTVQLLLQVHDSVVFQAPSAEFNALKSPIKAALSVVVPYPDPLIIPVGLKTSTKSWGDCKPEAWE